MSFFLAPGFEPNTLYIFLFSLLLLNIIFLFFRCNTPLMFTRRRDFTQVNIYKNCNLSDQKYITMYILFLCIERSSRGEYSKSKIKFCFNINFSLPHPIYKRPLFFKKECFF